MNLKRFPLKVYTYRPFLGGGMELPSVRDGSMPV